MKLKTRTIRDLAEMVTGGVASGFSESPKKSAFARFPYRSSSALTDFFIDCDTEYRHNSESRVPWTQNVLAELNEGPVSTPQLPADGIVRVIEELLDPKHFRSTTANEDHAACLELLNEVLNREGLKAYLDGADRCHVGAGSITSASLNIQKRVWTQKDLERKKKWVQFLDHASEDEFTEGVLVPLLQQCGFMRINVAGHKDKALEYGKDIWMKLQLPTSHFIYFAVQVKKGKIDAAGKSKADHENVAEVLNQVKMAIAHPIFDPELNKRVLVDHVYIVASGEITKQAKQFLGEKLDIEGRRQTIFMDREDILTLAVQTNMELPNEAPRNDEVSF
ncbi:MAG: hypothetical protein AABP62_00330 [Planctomycetota bacterium]